MMYRCHRHRCRSSTSYVSSSSGCTGVVEIVIVLIIVFVMLGHMFCLLVWRADANTETGRVNIPVAVDKSSGEELEAKCQKSSGRSRGWINELTGLAIKSRTP